MNRSYALAGPWPRLLNRSLVWLLALCALAPGTGAEVVFDNTQIDYDNQFFPLAFEYGDEAVLGGTARIVTEFQFQYYGEFNPTGNEQVQVRFYATDGHWTNNATGQSIRAPGTLLYTSEVLPLYAGFNTLALRNLAVAVSSNFVWTVQFQGLSGLYQHRAGLSFYNPASVGFSYDDFWVYYPPAAGLALQGWAPLNFKAHPVANFAAKILAGPDPPLVVRPIPGLDHGSPALEIRGPTYQGVVLESSEDLINWMSRQTFALAGQPIEFVDRTAPSALTRFYRVRSLAGPVILLGSSYYTTNALFKFQLTASPLHSFTVEASTDLNHWFPIRSGYLNGLNVPFTDPNASSFPSRRFYRAAITPDFPVLFSTETNSPTRQPQLKLFGPPGRDCRLEASADLRQWQAVATNTFSYATQAVSSDYFSFAGGIINYTDSPVLARQSRFYRAVLLP